MSEPALEEVELDSAVHFLPPAQNELLKNTNFEDNQYFESLPIESKCEIYRWLQPGSDSKTCAERSESILRRPKAGVSRVFADVAVALSVVAVRSADPQDDTCASYLSLLAWALATRWTKRSFLSSFSTSFIDHAIHFSQQAVVISSSRGNYQESALYMVRTSEYLLQALCTTRESLYFVLAQIFYKSARLLTRKSPTILRLPTGFLPRIPRLLLTVPSRVYRSGMTAEAFELRAWEHNVFIFGASQSAHPAETYSTVGAVFGDLFEILSDDGYHVKAFWYLQKALEHAPSGHRDHYIYLKQLSGLFRSRYQKWKKSSDQQQYIIYSCRVVRDNVEHIETWNEIAQWLQALADNSAVPDKEVLRLPLLRALPLLVKSLDQVDRRPPQIYNLLSNCFRRIFLLHHHEEDVNRAVDFMRHAVLYARERDLKRTYNTSLAVLLEFRYGRFRSHRDLEEALEIFRSCSQEAADTTEDVQLNFIWGIGRVSLSIYFETRNSADLNDAIANLCKAETLLADRGDDYMKWRVCLGIGTAYRKKAELEAELEAQDQILQLAVNWLRKGQRHLDNVVPPPERSDALEMDEQLAQIFLQRYDTSHSEEDVDSAIFYFRRSLADCECKYDALVSRSAGLAHALRYKSSIKKDRKYLLEADSILRKAEIEAPPNHEAFRVNVEVTMAQLYRDMSSLANTDSDLVSAVHRSHNALNSVDVGKDLSQYSYLVARFNHALNLRERAVKEGSIHDLRMVLDFLDPSKHPLPADHPLKALAKYSRAQVLGDLFLADRTQYVNEGKEAVSQFREAVRDPHLYRIHRITSAMKATFFGGLVDSDVEESSIVLKEAVDLLPETVLLHLNRTEVLNLVRQTQFLPSTAAAFSLGMVQGPISALRILEGASGFIWDRLLNKFASLDRLRKEHPDLAERLENKRKAAFSTPKAPIKLDDLSSGLRFKDDYRLRHEIEADSFQSILKQIRDIEGYGDFLRIPTSSPDLQALAESGPIVFLNVCFYRSDAIIITKSRVFYIHLGDFDFKNIGIAMGQIRTAQEELFDEETMSTAFLRFEKVARFLWYTAAKPVLDALRLDFSQYRPVYASKRRVYWVLSGLMNVLPIHIAGDYTPQAVSDEPSSVQDLVVSSYIPSLRALEFLQKGNKELENVVNLPSIEVLLVGMPNTPDMRQDSNLDVMPELLAAKASIEARTPVSSDPLINPSSGPVTKRLESCQIAHFACHGIADERDPSLSTVRLADWAKKPLNVRAILRLSIPKCYLIYLSMCESALVKDLDSINEGLQIASAFHMAGIPHAISTLWRVSSTVSRDVASHFYRACIGNDSSTADGELDVPAVAFHCAVEHVRHQRHPRTSDKLHPIYWSAFIHSGP